ncbi:hypothetical protein ACIBEF_32185 [Micromonospora sp. NPDC050795]|uniref:hypothetical protein n=1 Tax=Micromonospora sp. NPDC050795 TaxID=3364282 RepID=UPI0037BD4612
MELTLPSGMARLRPKMRATELSGYQAAVLAVLIKRSGDPATRDVTLAALPRGSRPPAAAQSAW